MKAKSNYFPWGFERDKKNPIADQTLALIEKRMEWLNDCHALSGLEGQIFASALLEFAKAIDVEALRTLHSLPDGELWELLMLTYSKDAIADITNALAPHHANERPRLDFPNAVALVDCRFVATKEWEFLRRYSIGGSEVSAIMGLSHYSSPRKLYFDKRGEIPETTDINKQFIFDYGHCVEDYVVDTACAVLGASRYPESRMFRHKDYPFISCNPDAILEFPDGSLALFEAKTATRFKKEEWYRGIPEYYAPQPQQYLEVLDDPRLTCGYIGVVFSGLPNAYKIHKYERDKEMAKTQVQAICDFWHNYMETDIIPPLSGNASLDLDAVYCTPCSQNSAKATLDAKSLDAFAKYFALKESRKEIDKKVNALKNVEDEQFDSIVAKYPLSDNALLCKKKDGMTYRIRQLKRNSESVDLAKIPNSMQNIITAYAIKQQSPSIGFSNPKISSKAIPKAKAKK